VRGSPRLVRRPRPSRAPAAAVVLDGGLYAVRRSPPPRPARSASPLPAAAAPAPPPPVEVPKAVPAPPPAREGDAHARRWLVIGIGVWLATAAVLFSSVRDLQPRYLEAVTPALAATIGIGGGTLLRRAGEWTAALLLALALAGSAAFALTLGNVPDEALTVSLAAGGLALVLLVAGVAPLSRGLRAVWSLVLGLACATALLAAPTGVSIDLVHANATAAGTIGAGAEFADYLHAHRHGAYYEVASASVNGVTTLIAQDAQPVLVLNDFHGPIVALPKLKQLVERRAVRHVIISRVCLSGIHCPATTRWSLRHAREVMRGGLYEYILPITLATDRCSATSGHQFSQACSRLVATTAPPRPPAPAR
jgi:hypothetical protein